MNHQHRQRRVPHLIPLGWITHEGFEVKQPSDISYTPMPNDVLYSFDQKPIPWGLGIEGMNIQTYINKHSLKRKQQPMNPHSSYFRPGTLLVPIKEFPVFNTSLGKYQTKNEPVLVVERTSDQKTDCLLITALDSNGNNVVFKMLEQDIEATYNLYFKPE